MNELLVQMIMVRMYLSTISFPQRLNPLNRKRYSYPEVLLLEVLFLIRLSAGNLGVKVYEYGEYKRGKAIKDVSKLY
jgi:hypothetical protein